MNPLSPCGTRCTQRARFPLQCAGCEAIQGKVWWLQYTGAERCAVYDCCVLQNGYSNCGGCARLPCEWFTKDPTISDEENEAHLSVMLQNLKAEKQENKEQPLYCILVTGIPASGKSTLAQFIADELKLPLFSKDKIKEILFDTVGFRSREEKVALGTAAMDIMYHAAEQLMQRSLPFLLENNFENASKKRLLEILKDYGYTAVTVMLTGDYRTIYQRMIDRDLRPDRHRGHIVNDRYPSDILTPSPNISFDLYVAGIKARGMDTFTANGPSCKNLLVLSTIYKATQYRDFFWSNIRLESARDRSNGPARPVSRIFLSWAFCPQAPYKDAVLVEDDARDKADHQPVQP